MMNTTSNRMLILSSMLVALCLLPAAATSAENDQWIKASGAYYLDSRSFSTASIVLSSNRLPLGLSLWGFTDFHGDHGSDDLSLTRSFSEYRLSSGGLGNALGIPGLGFQAELNALSGSGNDLIRAGLTYKHKIAVPWSTDLQGWLQWRALPYESDNNGGQASLIFFLPVTERIHVKGFADYNVIENSSNRWVGEPELNIKLGERMWALVEYRYNQFEEANPAIRGSALAVGLRYQFSR